METPVMSGMPVVPLKVRCACANRRTLPVWLVSDTLTELRSALAGVLQPARPVLTYRCRFCKQTIVLRAKDLFLTVDSETE